MDTVHFARRLCNHHCITGQNVTCSPEGPWAPPRHSLCKENRFPSFSPVGVLCRALNMGTGGTGRWFLHVAWWDPTVWI